MVLGRAAARLDVDHSLQGHLREFGDAQRELQEAEDSPEGAAEVASAPPLGARLVTFPLEPKPREAAMAVEWVRCHWILHEGDST